jgi:Na+-transporting NADH:ubiquinone oxidoreductase subunit C
MEGDKNYIVPVRGNGLWDEIWGFITLEADGNTIKGVSFDHKGETPGLGAEIKDNNNWKKQFIGTKLFEGDEFVGVDVVKGGIKKPEHQVDGISGATITGVGVAAMIKNDINKYVAYIEKNVKQ